MIWICDASTAPRCGPTAQPQGHVKRKPHEPDNHALGLSCGGFSTKIGLVSDGAGLQLAFTLTPGSGTRCRLSRRL
jgi:hypothetical protein